VECQKHDVANFLKNESETVKSIIDAANNRETLLGAVLELFKKCGGRVERRRRSNPGTEGMWCGVGGAPSIPLWEGAVPNYFLDF